MQYVDNESRYTSAIGDGRCSTSAIGNECWYFSAISVLPILDIEIVIFTVFDNQYEHIMNFLSTLPLIFN